MELNIRAGTLGPVTDDKEYNPRGDNWMNLLVAENGPRFLEWNRRGLMYAAGSVTTLAIPIFSTPTSSPTLWNPGKSKNLLVVTRIAGVLGAAAASIPDSGFGLLISWTNTDQVGANGYFTAFTLVAANTPYSLRDGTLDGVSLYSQAPTWAAIPSTVMWLGKNQYTLGTPTMAGFGDLYADLEGTIVLWPGMAVSLVASVASVTSFMPMFTYAKLPLPVSQ